MEKIIEIPNIFSATKDYVDKWVSLSEDYKKVIASGETLSEVLKKTPPGGRAVVFKVLPNLNYAPSQI
ncbi:MAG: DUF5678 domain-containing protein [Patescibacteria group bacterium]